ncbi:photosynthetic NDH subunit of subcomplex B 4, chloroplastic [Humulus lupulus]|uniref:photosynthetic NDH subunit of subcomplex B 4, chloroplastic n=1 Tax=Humulus lupulus TaxID=3486 RepID=UPI002B416FE3|nr:photosynthetic NDH subunit of subcomplex B 4, chloroplastic [Humulus lupulus]
MAEAVMSFSIIKPPIHTSAHVQTTKLDLNSSSRSLRQCSSSGLFRSNQIEERKGKRGCLSKTNAFPDWPLMAVLVEHAEGQRDYIINKSVWHLSDNAIKNVYIGYMLFTGWGCLVFGSMKDPFYDSESYRGDGGDGTGHWIYDKQEDIEETARSELWREELIEEIELKVGGLRELEEAVKK